MDPQAQPSRSESGPAPFQPEVFGRYYLIDRIAMGGMAEIFKAKTFGAGGFENVLVIKRILAHLSENEQFVQMFMDEARISALLQHANIVRIYDFGKFANNYFLAMECVEGKDVKLLLRRLAERRKLLPRDFAVYIAMEAAKGLDYAHKRTTLQGQPLQIVHRDVSPSNILVAYTGEIKVADFGIVKAANCAETTDAGMLKGKFEYMSPEQAQGKELDKRSDIFALGIILHEMLTGRRLFKTDSDIKTLEKIKNGDFDRPSAINPHIPPRLDDIVMRALAIDTEKRYAEAKDLYQDLRAFLHPQSPDGVQQALSSYLQEIFAEDMEAERQRLEHGTSAAVALRDAAKEVDLDGDWQDNNTNSRNTVAGQPAIVVEPPKPTIRWPVIVGAATLGALIMGGGLGGLYLYNQSQEKPAAPTAAAPTTGSVTVSVKPVAGKVYIDDRLIGEGAEVTVGDLSPDASHTLRVEADGHQPYTDTLKVGVGDKLRQAVTLTPVATPVAPAAPEAPKPEEKQEEAKDAVALFTSSPSGAEVSVSGRRIGTTPVEWKGGSAGSKYDVVYRKDGYQDLRFTASLPKSGKKDTFNRTLSPVSGPSEPTTPKEVQMSKLSANVAGGWAEIYVDGAKIGNTPISNHAIPAGSHTVRAKNDKAGLDQTRKITVKPGESASLHFTIE